MAIAQVNFFLGSGSSPLLAQNLIFTIRESLSRFTGEKYCVGCNVDCPFDASYETLNDRLFNQTLVPVAKQYMLTPLPKRMVSVCPTIAIFYTMNALCRTCAA